MISRLKNHPFAVEAFFESSLVLSFAVPKAALQDRIPPCLSLDLFEDQWTFVAVAMVQTSGLRPKGFPRIFGHDFFLIGYRIFVRYTNRAGKRLRGLYILKSETNKKKMEFLGNLFTHYNYTTTDIQQETSSATKRIYSSKSAFDIQVKEKENADLPLNSPFVDWKAARRFAGPLPFTFSYFPENKKVLIIQGVRQNWKPQPVEVLDYQIPFLQSLNLKTIQLANAFVIKQVPYAWKKGRIETWEG